MSLSCMFVRRRLFTLLFVSCLVAGSGLESGQPGPAEENKDRLIVETLMRLKAFDLEANPKVKQAVLRHLDRQRGTPQYVKLAKRFQLREALPELLEIAIANPDVTLGVDAARTIVELGELKEFVAVVNGKSPERAARCLDVLGRVDQQQVRSFLLPLVTDQKTSRVVRNAAARSLGRSRLGERQLLLLAQQKKVIDDTRFAIGDILLASADASIRKEASSYFKLPAGANATPLPPIPKLMKIKGNFEEGKKLFDTTATCAKCHKVRGVGKEVGPDLSEIGSKLSREALYVSILDPSAGISHNYETYLVELASGNVLSGIIISRTDDAVTLKDKEAIQKVVKRSDIELIKKSETSLMPVDLVKTLTKHQLADIVEYLANLKKQSGPPRSMP